MSRSSERLELVTDFAQLRAGMIIVAKECGICGRNHRGMLMGLEKSETIDVEDVGADEWNWGLVPPASCGADCIGEDLVERWRCVYRVVDGLESDATTERRKEAVR